MPAIRRSIFGHLEAEILDTEINDEERQLLELLGEQPVIPGGDLGKPIIGNHEGPDLHWGGPRITLRPHNPITGEEVEKREVAKGYEYRRGQFVTFTPEELKALDVESSKVIIWRSS